jgi:glycosyltransferase involved in cell wall biosynthesis
MEKEQNKPKILIFSLAYAPFIGGAEIAVQEITKRLVVPPVGGFEFDVITANLDGKQEEREVMNGVTIYRVGKTKWSKFFYPWLANKKAAELNKNNNYQIVWGVLEFWAGWAALKFKEKFPQVKYVLTMQSGDSDAFVFGHTFFWYWRYRQIFIKADYIQVISNWLAKRARKYGYKGEIGVVPNGVIINSQQSAINKNKDQKIILTVSRLVKKNGVADLIKAMKILDAKLMVVGTGKLKEKLKKLAQKNEMADKVEFIGRVPYEELGAYYGKADVFCRPSLSEGLGNSFLEAMAAGVPVIATPVGGIPDFLKEGETGWFCEPKNSKSIAEKIEYVLDEKNKEEVARVVANAKKMVMEKYTWEKVAGQMREIINNLLSS